jgi:hypothetical protein
MNKGRARLRFCLFLGVLAVFASVGCAKKTTTIPPEYSFGAHPGEGVIIGHFSIENAGPVIGPLQLKQTITDLDRDEEYQLALTDRGAKSPFFVSLPAGHYQFSGGETTLLGQTSSYWVTTGAKFEVIPGQVTCIGSVIFEKTGGIGAAVGNAIMQQQLGTKSATPGKYTVHDFCDNIIGVFAEKYGVLAEDINIRIAESPKAKKDEKNEKKEQAPQGESAPTDEAADKAVGEKPAPNDAKPGETEHADVESAEEKSDVTP